ncbi:unnamed protein product, partial [Urochloa humidicola]
LDFPSLHPTLLPRTSRSGRRRRTLSRLVPLSPTPPPCLPLAATHRLSRARRSIPSARESALRRLRVRFSAGDEGLHQAFLCLAKPPPPASCEALRSPTHHAAATATAAQTDRATRLSPPALHYARRGVAPPPVPLPQSARAQHE